MNTMTDANSLFSGPVSLFTILAFILLGWLLRAMPKPAPARMSTLRLAPAQLVAMSDAEVTQAAHFIGSSVGELLAIDWDAEL